MAVYTISQGEKVTASILNTYAMNPGLTYVTGGSFSGAAAITLDNVFTSSAENYLFVINGYSTSGAVRGIYAKMRVGGVTTTGSDYYIKGWYNNGTLTGYAPAAGAFAYFGDLAYNAAYMGMSTVQIMSPQLATRTAFMASNVETFNTVVSQYNTTHAVSTAYDGIYIYPSSGSFTGTYRLYSYRQA